MEYGVTGNFYMLRLYNQRMNLNSVVDDLNIKKRLKKYGIDANSIVSLYEPNMNIPIKELSMGISCHIATITFNLRYGKVEIKFGDYKTYTTKPEITIENREKYDNELYKKVRDLADDFRSAIEYNRSFLEF